MGGQCCMAEEVVTEDEPEFERKVLMATIEGATGR